MFANGQGRKLLINTVAFVTENFPASLNFGNFLVSEFAGIGGMIKADSSQNNVANIRFDYQTLPGSTIISSALLVASGGSVINELNPGAYVNISVAQINSATPIRLFLVGLPIR